MAQSTRRPSADLAPIVKEYGHTLVGGSNNWTGRTRRECWGAKTTDGRWIMEREDSSGTPWLLIHKATNRLADVAGTLRALRLEVANGFAYRNLIYSLERELAEQTIWLRGEKPAGVWCSPSAVLSAQQRAPERIARVEADLATVRAEMSYPLGTVTTETGDADA